MECRVLWVLGLREPVGDSDRLMTESERHLQTSMLMVNHVLQRSFLASHVR